MNLTQLVPLILIAVIAIVSFIGWRNTFVFQRYQFQIAAIRYNKQYQRLITSAFLHADGWHLFFNLFTLYFFSRVIAYIYGWLGFLLLFFWRGAGWQFVFAVAVQKSPQLCRDWRIGRRVGHFVRVYHN